MPECKCQYCDHRTPTCHGTCKDYLQFRKELDAINDARRKSNTFDEESYTRRLHWRNVRRKA